MTNPGTTSVDGERRLRSALFLDFDNVYLGLRRLDPEAAEAFAADPGPWMDDLAAGADEDGAFTRRFLIRACYLNPSAFAHFRAGFTRAGFQVVDCPSLTQQGKSSADINLVLDAVDALDSSTRYDEFVIMSADADFTPLALRLRAADRRVTIVTTGPTASAYRSVADTVVTADDFAEMVLPYEAEDEADTAAAAGATGPAHERTTAVSPARDAVIRLVRGAGSILRASAVATAAQKADPSLTSSRWDEAGGFFAWLARDVPEVASASRPDPGHVWDPQRFSEADLPATAEAKDLTSLQRQVSTVTEVPLLSTERFRGVFTALADDLARSPFDRAETVKRVHAACQDADIPVGRGSVRAVVNGVLFSGLTPTAKSTASQLATAWADNVIGLCKGARMELSKADVRTIREWVGGGLAAR